MVRNIYSASNMQKTFIVKVIVIFMAAFLHNLIKSSWRLKNAILESTWIHYSKQQTHNGTP